MAATAAGAMMQQLHQTEVCRVARSSCPQHTSRFVLHRRRAAAVCSQESAAPGVAWGHPHSPHNHSTTSSGGRPEQRNNKTYTEAFLQQQQKQQQHQEYGIRQPSSQDAGSGRGSGRMSSTAAAGAGTAWPQAASARAAASSPEAALSASIRLASSWQQLVSLLLDYSRTTAAAGAAADAATLQQTAAMPEQHSKETQKRPLQQQQQQHQEVLDAVKQLNGIHLARLLKALARLQPLAGPSTTPAATKQPLTQKSHGTTTGWSRQEQEAFWSLTQLAFSECVQQLPSLSAWELSTSLWAASKLTHAPPAFLLRRLLQQLAEPSILAAATAQDISMSLYAVASLAVQVPEQQLQALLAAASGRLPEAAPQAMTNTLWAVAALQHRPQQQWMQQWEGRCVEILQPSSQQQPWQQQHPQYRQEAAGSQHPSKQQVSAHQQQQQQPQRWSGPQFTPLGLHQLLWAMAKLQWQPTPAFQAGLWPTSLSQVQHMTPHGTSGILWAAASLALQPPQHWSAAWLSALQRQMQAGLCGPQDLGNALWAVVRLGLRPDECWLRDALQACQAVVPDAGTQELSNMLWSFAKLGVRPDASWMQHWLLAMQQRMSSYCAPALASSTYALAVLGFRPPQGWAQTLLHEAQRQMPAFGAQELSNLVWALAVLGLRPTERWLKEFEEQAIHESGSFNSQELSIIFWSLAKLQHTPPAAWVARLLREGLEVAGGMQAPSLVLLLGSLTRWHLPEMHVAGHYRVLLPRYWAAAEQLLPQYNLRHLSALVSARAKLGHMPNRRWSRSFWRAVHTQLQPLATTAQPPTPGTAVTAGSSPADSISSCSSSGCGGHSSSALHHQQQALTTAFQALPPGVLRPAVVSQLLWGAGKLWQKGPVPWHCLQLLCAAAVAIMPQCSLAGITAVGIGIRAMLHNNRLLKASAVALRGFRARAKQRGRGHLQQARWQQRPRSSRGSTQPDGVLVQSQLRSSNSQCMPGSSNKSSCSRRRSVKRLRFRSVLGVRRRPAAVQVTSHELWQLARPVWDAWFTRSTQLLLLLQPLQANLPGTARQVTASAGNSLQRRDQQHQLKQQLKGAGQQVTDMSVQLRVVAALQLQPPAEWLSAVQTAMQQHMSQCSTEQLSWLLLDLLKVQQRMHPRELQLPQGFVAAVLSRARALHASQKGGWTLPQIQRLLGAFKLLKKCDTVSENEWQQWMRFMLQWRASQGLTRAVQQQPRPQPTAQG